MQLSTQLPSARSVTTQHASLSTHVALQAGERQQWKERPSQSLIHSHAPVFGSLYLPRTYFSFKSHLTGSQGHAADPDERYAFMARRNLSFNLSVN